MYPLLQSARPKGISKIISHNKAHYGSRGEDQTQSMIRRRQQALQGYSDTPQSKARLPVSQQQLPSQQRTADIHRLSRQVVNSDNQSSKLLEMRSQLTRDDFNKLQIEVNILNKNYENEKDRNERYQRLLIQSEEQMKKY